MRLPGLTIRRAMIGILVLAACVAPTFDRALIGLAPAVLLVLLITKAMPRPGRWRSKLATACAACGALLIPFAASALISKDWWGYYMQPPQPDLRLLEVRSVRTAAYARTQAFLDGDVAVTFAPLGPSSKVITSAEVDPFQRRFSRALVALDRRGKLPEELPRPGSRRSMELFPLLDGSGQLSMGEGPYVNAKDLRGIVIEADGADGTPLVFLAVRGGEVSRDRYPFYEFLFKGTLEAGPLELLSTRRFFFDLGWLEGFGWPELFAVIATVELAFLAALVFTTTSKKAPPAAAEAERVADAS